MRVIGLVADTSRPGDSMTVTRPVCKFRCQDTTCLQSWTFVCNGLPDCPDNSDEIHCPLNNLVNPGSHYSSFASGQSFAGLQNVSAIQIIVVAVSVIFTLGLITCVLSHYKMGARSWSERRNRSSPHKSATRDFHHYFHVSHCPQNLNRHCLTSLSSSEMPKMVFTPLDIEEKKQLKHTDIHNKSVQTDITLDLPFTVTMPDGEEYPYGNAKTLHIRDREQESEIYRGYIKPPPNRTVSELNVLATSRSYSDEFYCKRLITTTDSGISSQVKIPRFGSFSSNQLSCQVSPSNSPKLCLVSIPNDLNNRTSETVENLLDQAENTPPPPYSEVMESMSFIRPIKSKQTGSGV